MKKYEFDYPFKSIIKFPKEFAGFILIISIAIGFMWITWDDWKEIYAQFYDFIF